MLNVTEHRKNWFELPEVFRFAEVKQMYLHINTCVHPHNVTLYTLPSDQLSYVLAFLEEQRGVLLAEYPRLTNLASYDFLLSLVRSELGSRQPDWRAVASNLNRSCDGLLGAPRAGSPPFDTPEKVTRELERITLMLDRDTAARMVSDIIGRLSVLADADRWRVVSQFAERLLPRLTPSPPL
jgi:hypothetical protein